MTDDYRIKRLYKALEIACSAIRSGDISPSEEYRWLLSYALQNDLESYFIKEAEKCLKK